MITVHEVNKCMYCFKISNVRVGITKVQKKIRAVVEKKGGHIEKF